MNRLQASLRAVAQIDPEHQGTPQSLDDAIARALIVLGKYPDLGQREIIAAHVKDFLSQKFSPYLLGEDIYTRTAIQALWESIVRRAPR